MMEKEIIWRFGGVGVEGVEVEVVGKKKGLFDESLLVLM